jgi:glutamine amidotransferase
MRNKITIIDYGLGNLASVANALEKLGVSYEISGDPAVIKKATALILPGVGAAGQGMKNLKKRKLDKVLIEEIKKGKPFLGICLGMQLLFEKSEEGNVMCLGIFDGVVKKFKKMRKVPQIGWNNIKIKNQESRIMKNISDDNYVYYVNSFYCKPKVKTIIAGETTYGETFATIVVNENVVGMQFHPEKSGTVGFTLLNNFITYYVN